MERKLAAILAADVVGYSALMEADEAGTHERLKAGRKELFEPEIARHHGRVFKVMGDGLLAEFASVVNAVECAVALQRGLAERNAAVPPQQRVPVRIGINLGEVIVEGDDRYGEGVNIATRIEQLADPGGICVSGKVAKEVEKKLAFGFEPMGQHKVKNIQEPIAVFRIKLDGVSARRPARLSRTRLWHWAALAAAIIVIIAGASFVLRPFAPEAVVTPTSPATDTRLSLVVLPFANLSDDKEQGYLADGMTEDLTTELARLPGLFVISRNAAFTYKGKAVQPAQIAKELGVRYILEGSTRRVGDEMRINAQLIDATTGGHLWAERFDGKWSEVFALQDKVVTDVASALQVRLVIGESKADVAGGTSNPAAYDAFLRGLELAMRGTADVIPQAVAYFNQALALDPNFGQAAAELAWVYWDTDDVRMNVLGLSSGEEIEAKMYENLTRAAAHPSPSYYQLTAQLLTREHKSDEAIAGLQAAVALDPSNHWTFEILSQTLIFNGRPQEGRAYLDTAMRLDPTGSGGWSDFRYYLAGLAAFSEDRFEDAVRSLEKIDLQSPYPWPKFYGLQVLLSAYGHLGRGDKLERTHAELQALLAEMGEIDYDRLRVQYFFVFKNEADIARLLNGLTKAGMPEVLPEAGSAPTDRLTAAEMKSLVFGHELRGRRTDKPAEYRRTTAIDGSATVVVGSEALQGMSWTQAGYLCTAYPRDLTSCGVIYRNPRGTPEQSNQYRFIFHRPRYEFSVVK